MLSIVFQHEMKSSTVMFSKCWKQHRSALKSTEHAEALLIAFIQFPQMKITSVSQGLTNW